MLAYVDSIQRAETLEKVKTILSLARNLMNYKSTKQKVETLTHQKWSGADLVDAQLNLVTGGASSTLSMGKGVTEVQFGGEKSE